MKLFFNFHLTSWLWWKVNQFYLFIFWRDHILFVFKKILELPSYHCFLSFTSIVRYLYIYFSSIPILPLVFSFHFKTQVFFWPGEMIFGLSLSLSVFLPLNFSLFTFFSFSFFGDEMLEFLKTFFMSFKLTPVIFFSTLYSRNLINLT